MASVAFTVAVIPLAAAWLIVSAATQPNETPGSSGPAQVVPSELSGKVQVRPLNVELGVLAAAASSTVIPPRLSVPVFCTTIATLTDVAGCATDTGLAGSSPAFPCTSLLVMLTPPTDYVRQRPAAPR